MNKRKLLFYPFNQHIVCIPIAIAMKIPLSSTKQMIYYAGYIKPDFIAQLPDVHQFESILLGNKCL